MKTKEEIQAQIAKLQDELNEQEAKSAAPWPRETKYYLYGSKEQAWEVGEKIGLDDVTIARNFLNCCYVVTVTLQVHQNGDAFVTHLDNSTVTPPVKVAGQ